MSSIYRDAYDKSFADYTDLRQSMPQLAKTAAPSPIDQYLPKPKVDQDYNSAILIADTAGQGAVLQAKKRFAALNPQDTYTWSAKGELLSSTVNGVTTTYVYDESGQRIKKTVNGVTTRYLTPTYSKDSTGKISYTIQLGGINIAEVTQSGETEEIKYLETDHLGSTTKVTDANGNVMESNRYRPYGPSTSSGQAQTDRGYIGERFDPQTGLNYLNARYYNSSQGRFISQDPMFWNLPKEALANPQLQNSYSYSLNNPIVYKDTDGRIPAPVIGGLIGGGIGSVVGYYQTGSVKGALPYTAGGALAGAAAPIVAGIAGPTLAGYVTTGIVTNAIAGATTTLTSGQQYTGEQLGRDASLGALGGTIAKGMGSGVRLAHHAWLYRSVGTIERSDLPESAFNALTHLEGTNFSQKVPGTAKGGRYFRNDFSQLPKQAKDYYKEWDINPRGENGRDAFRLVTGQNGEVYYTDNHYGDLYNGKSAFQKVVESKK